MRKIYILLASVAGIAALVILTLHGVVGKRPMDMGMSVDGIQPQGSTERAIVPDTATLRPAHPTWSTAGCHWVWNETKTIGVWSETCTFNDTDWHLAPLGKGDEGFDVLASDYRMRTAIQVFTLQPGTTIDTLLPTLVQRGTPATECVFKKNDAQSLQDRTVYELVPTGARLHRFETQGKTEVPDDPCGTYGISAEGQRIFEVWHAHPTAVLFFDYGQDGSLFDYDSLTFL
jgi:hypothetical protein